MPEASGRKAVSPGRMVTTAVFHAALLVLFIVFLSYIVPEFAATAANYGGPLPASAQLIIRVGDYVQNYWFWAIPLAAVADTAALFAIAKSFGKRGLLVWSVIVGGFFAGLMILGMIGMLEAVARMG